MASPGYTRRQEFACTLDELEKYASAILYEHEVLYVKQADGSYDIKIGDGVTPVGKLPYVIRHSELRQMYTEMSGLITVAERAAERAQEIADGFDLGLSVVGGQICIEFEEE